MFGVIRIAVSPRTIGLIAQYVQSISSWPTSAVPPIFATRSLRATPQTITRTPYAAAVKATSTSMP